MNFEFRLEQLLLSQYGDIADNKYNITLGNRSHRSKLKSNHHVSLKSALKIFLGHFSTFI